MGCGLNIKNILKEIEDYAIKWNVPIMQDSSLSYIENLIKSENINNVLEIGTAIGYSAIRMSLVGCKVTSVERDLDRYNKALQNVNKINLDKSIKLIFSDAFDTNIKDKFDMILIDAAKGKNIDFINKFKSNLNNNGLIIIDNVDFHGLVGKSSEIKSRNLRSLVSKSLVLLKLI